MLSGDALVAYGGNILDGSKIVKINLKVFILIILLSLTGNAFEHYKDFSQKLIGNKISEQNNAYNKMVQELSADFLEKFVNPMTIFAENELNISSKTLFYPFAGADISYPLLFCPNCEIFVLIGQEFPGNPEFINKNFDLDKFYPQVEGYLKSGFFKTMNMSAQMLYEQGVIPMLAFQIAILGGKINTIEIVDKPSRGISINFIYRKELKKLFYFRTNLDDSLEKTDLFEFLKKNNLTDNCMLKASSYKLQQPEFIKMSDFMINNCKSIIQDDTGIAVKKLMSENFTIKLFGNYEYPYGNEFRNFYQPDLAKLYQNTKHKIHLDFCYGYGCMKVEPNILYAKKIW